MRHFLKFTNSSELWKLRTLNCFRRFILSHITSRHTTVPPNQLNFSIPCIAPFHLDLIFTSCVFLIRLFAPWINTSTHWTGPLENKRIITVIEADDGETKNKKMCQLLGMNCAAPTDFSFSFQGFSQRGGATDIHSHGWGLAIYEGKGLRLLLDTLPCCSSPVATLVKNYPIKTYNMLAHIRYATQGGVSLENVHPFQREMVSRTELQLYWNPHCMLHTAMNEVARCVASTPLP